MNVSKMDQDGMSWEITGVELNPHLIHFVAPQNVVFHHLRLNFNL